MRLIDADAIISFIDAGHLRNPLELAWSDNDVVDMIESRPTIDAVPVVRCGECKWGEPDTNGAGQEMVMCYNAFNPVGCENWIVSPDWFCADGERKDGETNGET